MIEGHGDDDFESFAAAELPRLLRVARLLTGSDHDAWDLTQDCLVRVGLRWARVDTRRNPAAYAKTCLVRLNLNRLRRLGSEQRANQRAATLPRQADQDPAMHFDPWLDRALKNLSPQQRAAVVLRHLEDVPVEGIGQLLGCSTGTVKTHLARGLRKLQQSASTARET